MLQRILKCLGQGQTNLQAAKVRMLFVADKIPVELRSIVEFLNKQMDPAEVLAVVINTVQGKAGIANTKSNRPD